MKSWKVIVALLALWLLIMIYMSNTVFQPSDGNVALERELKQTLRELDKLKAQNGEFQKLASEIRCVFILCYFDVYAKFKINKSKF